MFLAAGTLRLPATRGRVVDQELCQLFDFTLDDGAMTELDALEEGLVSGWDPAEQP